MATWYLYLLECRGGRLYAGISPDPEKRLALHRAGRGAAFTRINPPLRLLGATELPDRAAATRAEAALRRLSRERKLRWAREHPWAGPPATGAPEAPP